LDFHFFKSILRRVVGTPVPVPPLVRISVWTYKHNIELNPAFACDLLKLFARNVPAQLVGSARKLIILIRSS
jgi:hypothetical protein